MRKSIPPRLLPLAFLSAATLLLPAASHAQLLTDFKARFASMVIKKATFENLGTLDVDFYRHNFEVELGIGQAFVGATYQYATKEVHTRKLGNSFGKREDGVMLTAGYSHLLSSLARVEAYGRLGVWGDTNPAQALYATDSDLRLSLILFDPDGFAAISRRAVFPSAQVGVNVNKYGRVQGLAGVGLWWNHLGAYLSGFQSFNGVEDARHPGRDADKIFANLKNSGVTFCMTYELREFMLLARQNYALQNGGHDFTISLQYQHFFRKQR
ncbi:MAG: hypothetical protein ONB48_16780 [candidate division KSB1 bacterium]|nr:hypothetical protein [candidate division KSB1 bacterium]MDZ7275134.1 hypothetical protein [candidate division KSB1 bacterium]MDZ7287304.1 hypothetical protein [candidate division KSB1 bacterium]MDZ7299418.1 hypothetical protein [candidate division KSB1 bacterium]MDZ7308057.1 hypothetical protein [candidate division KSB1 bacterium]